MIKSRRSTRIILFIFILLGSFIVMYPLFWMISSSFKPEDLIFKDKSLWIRKFTLENYIEGWKGVGGNTFVDYFRNTFMIVIPVVIANLISCSMTGYAFARLKFAGSKWMFSIMILTLMLPMHASLIPRYIVFKKMEWIDTFLPLIVPRFFAIDAFFCFLFVQFIRGIPPELDQSATVDGCSPISIYWRIIIPLAAPAMLTTAIFTFIWTYNDFFGQLIYLNDPRRFTIALALRQFVEATDLQAYGQLFAMSVVSLIPIFIFFISCQKYIIEGIATSGLKG